MLGKFSDDDSIKPSRIVAHRWEDWADRFKHCDIFITYQLVSIWGSKDAASSSKSFLHHDDCAIQPLHPKKKQIARNVCHDSRRGQGQGQTKMLWGATSAKRVRVRNWDIPAHAWSSSVQQGQMKKFHTYQTRSLACSPMHRWKFQTESQVVLYESTHVTNMKALVYQTWKHSCTTPEGTHVPDMKALLQQV